MGAEAMAIAASASIYTFAGLVAIVAVAVGGLVWMYRQPRTKHQRFRERF